MSSLEVKISQSKSELKTILKNVDGESTASLLDILKQAKEETNQFLTTLVEGDRFGRATVIKQAGKRKSCDELKGGDGAKRSGTCHDGDKDGGDSDSAGDDE